MTSFAPDSALPLSELQQAAAERIAFFQGELRKYGVYARTGIELEFAIIGNKNYSVPCRFPIQAPRDYLRNKGIPYVEGYKMEGSRLGTKEDQYSTQHEFQIGEDASPHPGSPRDYSPAHIAGIVHHLRAEGLADMLRDSTMLSSIKRFPNAKMQNGALRVHFMPAARYRWSDQEHAELIDTLGMHINVSLWDEKQNLFSKSPALVQQCMNSLLRVQKSALLAHMPSTESLLRIRHGGYNVVPKGIGQGKGFIVNEGASADLRRSADYPQYTRIESNLAGMDADPFVLTAVTLAALYDAVKRSVHVDTDTKPDHSVAMMIGEQKAYVTKPQRPMASEPFPKRYQEIIERFEGSQFMHELLGERLYEAIKQEYSAPIRPSQSPDYSGEHLRSQQRDTLPTNRPPTHGMA